MGDATIMPVDNPTGTTGDGTITPINTSPQQPSIFDSIVAAISGGIDISRAIKGTDLDHAREAAAAADPFSSQRGYYQDLLKGATGDLNSLLTDPNSFKKDPGYQFALDQGLDSVARKGNAMFGTTRAGTTAVDLEKFGTGFAAQSYNNRINQLLARIGALTPLTGATSGSPAAAANALTQGYANRDRTTAGGLSGLDKLLNGLFGNGSGIGGALSSVFRSLFGGNTDGGGSGSDVTGSTDEFLRSIGIDPTQLSPEMQQEFEGILGDPTNPTGGGGSLNLGDVSDSTGNLLGDLFPGGIGGP